MSVTLHFHGAAGCVTGSCMLIETHEASVLVDCGMFQGSKTLKALNYGDFPFDPRKIDSVLLTHAHIDHSGLLPKLALAGFEGAIHATPGTIDLCRVMLPDAGAIQETEVVALNRRRRQKGEAPVTPIYTAADSEAVMRQFDGVELKTWKAVAPGLKARWWNAGHILGAASIEVEAASKEGPPTRLLFSGDLGPGGSDFVDDPEGPAGIDHLVMESTYGAVERKPYDGAARRKALAEEMRMAHAAGGPLLIPAFAVERTQELIVDLLDLMEQGEAPRGPVFLDSPLAIRASEVFLTHGRNGDGENPFARLRRSSFLHFTESAPESRAIEQFDGWHVIVAASGMCDAGRVRHHLKRLLPRPEATVLLIGFQAMGTLGRFLQEGRRGVRIQGDEIRVRAGVRSIDAYSGHADSRGLLAWAKARAPISGSVFLTHGEPENLSALKTRLRQSDLGVASIEIAELDRAYLVKPSAAAAAREAPAPRIPLEAVAHLDWHNSRAEFLTALNRALDAAASDSERDTLLQRLSAALRR
jgi:metallo-beta-lactamase family protein